MKNLMVNLTMTKQSADNSQVQTGENLQKMHVVKS